MEAQTLVAFNGGLITVGLRRTAEVVSPHSWLKRRCGFTTPEGRAQTADGMNRSGRWSQATKVPATMCIYTYDLQLQRAGLWSAEV